MHRLAIGTAQFGMPYGVANQQGQVSLKEAEAILCLAREAGIDTLDTAIAYGESEERLGQIGVQGFKIVTKLPGLSKSCSSVESLVKEAIFASLKRLRVDQLYGVLLHRPSDLLEQQGEKLYEAIQCLKSQGWVEKIGVSIYEPEELEALYPHFVVELVQAPFNGLDQRLITSGWLPRLKQDGVEVHGRSLFLQGLLLMSAQDRPKKFGRWQALWQSWDNWLSAQAVTPLEACLGCVWHQPSLDRILVGVDSLSQLQKIIMAIDGNLPRWPSHIKTDDLDLINPTRWTSL